MSFGVSMFNLPLATNLTMFQDAFLNEREETKTRVIELAKKQGVDLTLEWEISRQEMLPTGQVPERRPSAIGIGSGGESPVTRRLPAKNVARKSTDLLKKALKKKGTSKIEEAVRLVCSDVAPFTSSAKIIKNSFRDLLLQEFRVLEDMLLTSDLLHEVCLLDVHVSFLDPDLRRDKAIHMITSDSYLEWSEPNSQDTLNDLWKRKSPKIIKGLEADGNKSTKKASLTFLRIEDAAKVGIQGILRPLLFQHVPLHFFQYRAVKWVVLYKWLRIWRKRFIRQGFRYAGFLILFTLYAAFLASTNKFSESDLSLKITCSCLLGVSSVFGWFMAFEEFLQMLTYCKEGKSSLTKKEWTWTYFRSFEWKLVGVLPYFFTFKWNWVDMFSCLMLTILIPLFHILAFLLSGFEEVLSILVALEAITAYVKVTFATDRLKPAIKFPCHARSGTTPSRFGPLDLLFRCLAMS